LVEVDTKQLAALALQCRLVDPALEKDLLVGLVAGGEIVAAKARRNAASFSRKGDSTSRIADSVAVRRRGVRVRVQAGGNAAPEAAPLENHGKSGTFRHPVPNTGKWVDQPAHPFLTPAGEESIGEVEAFIVGLVDVTLRLVV
jgi:hypothetical protein